MIAKPGGGASPDFLPYLRQPRPSFAKRDRARGPIVLESRQENVSAETRQTQATTISFHYSYIFIHVRLVLGSMDQALPPVYQYIWRDYSLPGYKGLVLTLSTMWGIVAFAFFASLLAIAQTRFWIILRYLSLHFIWPIHIEVESEQELSQLDALRALFGRHKDRNAVNSQSISNVPKTLGIVAAINVAGFFICGILAPLCLQGDLSTTVVLSKSTDTCIGWENRPGSNHYTTQLADSFFKKCLLNTSDTFSSCSTESGIVGSTPQFHTDRKAACPFPGDVCQDGVQPVRLEYMGLSPRDFGVNLRHQVLISQRVVCAPLKMDQFLLLFPSPDDSTKLREDKSFIWFGRKYHDPTFNSTDLGIWGTMLRTLNGPNRYSKEYSGNYLASFQKQQPVYDLDVYPFGLQDDQKETIHPGLQRDDGVVFIVMLRAGRSLYNMSAPIEDPFYAAHNTYPDTNLLIPDYEATALGCVEQYKLCWNNKTSPCTNWGRFQVAVVEMMAVARAAGDIDMLYDLGFVYGALTTMGSVHRYLLQRVGTQVLISSLFRDNFVVSLLDYKEQWILEVQAWFTTAFLNARYALLQIVRQVGSKRTGDEAEQILKICHSVLFQNNDYININFISLLACIVVLLLVCAFSWEPLPKACRKAWEVSIYGIGELTRRVQVVYRVCKFHEFLPVLAAFLPQSRFFRLRSQARFPWSAFWHGDRRRQDDQGLFSGPDSIALQNL
ncbi:hypothetical protein L207DRAFT_526152 [Hyaloscypha variabilis F]|uniref:Uncharacterized protein n=1 Tax=Hyaloscypha variabilis (strain UAMH 11265 / GT02V1 / F) TaxID=1149755 RepID=A0A2J6RWN2_HYAVF|nr:hypothetical protein L207DRAFT_526152 [Hyaloscypha variabilis F]